MSQRRAANKNIPPASLPHPNLRRAAVLEIEALGGHPVAQMRHLGAIELVALAVELHHPLVVDTEARVAEAPAVPLEHPRALHGERVGLELACE